MSTIVKINTDANPAFVEIPDGGGTNYQTMEESGVALPQEPVLDFITPAFELNDVAGVKTTVAINNATDTVAGLMSAADKVRLDTPKTFWSPFEVGKAAGANFSAFGNYTIGYRFLITRAGDTINGFKFWWPVASNKAIRCSIWDEVGTQTFVDVVVNGAGEYTATFAAPVALTAFRSYYLSVWVTDATT